MGDSFLNFLFPRSQSEEAEKVVLCKKKNTLQIGLKPELIKKKNL